MDIKTYFCAQIAENPHSGILYLSEPYPANRSFGKIPKRLSVIVLGLFLVLFNRQQHSHPRSDDGGIFVTG